MIPRTLAAKLDDASRHYPVVTVTGPRQSGKTTLVRAAFPDHEYLSLEAPDVRALALEDPRAFLGRATAGLILDEAQRAPELFSYLQGIVDADPRPGRFIVTGSQNFLLLRSISQSLAGRASVLHLLPFSLDELVGRSAIPLASLAMAAPPATRPAIGTLEETLFKGLFPAVHDRGLDPQDWCRNYFQTYLERDVRDLAAVGDIDAFGRFASLCAGRNGQILNLSSLGADCGVSHTTAARWLSVLRASFQVVLLRPYHRSFNKRIVKSPKLYFLDTGLLCYLLRVRSPAELEFHPARGAVVEAFVVSELWKRLVHQGLDPDLYFWRDSAGHEVDVVLDLGSQAVPVEVKSGRTLASDAFRGLDYWTGLAGGGANGGILVYGGDEAFRRHGVAVLPWWTV